MRILLLTVCVHTAMLGAHSLEDDSPSNNKKLVYDSNTDLFLLLSTVQHCLIFKKIIAHVFLSKLYYFIFDFMARIRILFWFIPPGIYLEW